MEETDRPARSAVRYNDEHRVIISVAFFSADNCPSDDEPDPRVTFPGGIGLFLLGCHNRLKNTKGTYEKHIQTFRKRRHILFE